MINFLKSRVVLVLLICLVSVTDGISQNLSKHNWYFGSGPRGIRFNRISNAATLVNNKNITFGTGGSAVATDPTNGDLLFYTDGVRVYNSVHLLMPGGLLNGNTTDNQPVAISPVPGQPTQYYVFTRDAAGSIFRSVVDLSLVGIELAPTPPLGDVVTASLNTPMGLAGKSEAMITVPHANGIDFWLLTQDANSDDYNATLINAAATFPTTSTLDIGLPMTAANFSYHAATGRIAVSPQSPNDNVAIFTFNNSTGAFIPFPTLTNSVVPNSAVSSISGESIYDTEWSLTGQFLYISRHGEVGIPADILQFDIANPGTSLATVLDFVPDRSFGLQMAPDSAVYYLYQATSGGPFLIGRLTNTDTVAIAVNDSASYFGAGLNFNATQFPAFDPRSIIPITLDFTTAGTCANSPVSFYPIVAPTADSLRWDFGDTQTTNDWSPIHTYTGPGPFSVTLTAFLKGQTQTVTKPVALTDFTLQLTLVQDTTACECELPVNNGKNPCPNDTSDDFSLEVTTQGGTGPFTFIWSNGDTGATLTPDSAGYYYVVVTDGGAPGCTAYAGVNIREYDAIDQRANIWYFGQGAGIDFNQPITAVAGPLNTPEGCSVISDRNGFVIFSTDGFRVYDRNNNEVTTVGVPAVPIAFPPGIGGQNDATQSALIMPVPNDETLYYIFTTQQVQGNYSYELRYSLYDIKLNGGDGGLRIHNQLLFSRSTERITGNANWLIAHEYGNNSFRAYQITQAGIGNPVISSIGSDHLINEELNGQGYMELGGADLLAVALSTANPPPATTFTNFLEFFDFDNATGAVTNFRSVNLNTDVGQVYGVEFSGSKVLATLRNTPNSFLRELYIDFQGNPVLVPPGGPPTPINEELGAIQVGPNGTIYVAENNKGTLGTISVNGDTLQLSNYNRNAFPLAAGTQSRLGLPNFIQSVGVGPQQASISAQGFCLGDSTEFTGGGTDPIDEFEWFFGDGFGANTQLANHLYATAGTYLVTLRVTNRCGLDTILTQSITIVAPPAAPTFLPPGQMAVLCNGPLVLEAEPAPSTPGYTYLWSDGSTNRTFTVTQQSVARVTITNALGCTTDGLLFVSDNRPQLDLGPDQTICQNTPIAPLDAQNPGAQFTWYTDEIANGNIAQTQPVTTAAAPDVVEYKVEVLDFITSCVAKDSIVFTINSSPTFNTITTNTSDCTTDDGQIDLLITGPAGSLFNYDIVGSTTGVTHSGVDQDNVAGVLPPIPATLGADTYIVTVTDQVSSCATTQTAVINDNAFTIGAIVQQNTCDLLILRVNHTATVVPYSFQVINTVTSQVAASGTSSALGFFDTPGVPSGTYIVQITSGGCSFTSPPQAFAQNAPVVVSLAPDECAGQITASGGTSYDWSTSPAGSINGATNNPIASINPGTWNLIVIVNDGVNCPGRGTITMTVEDVTPDFTQSDQCADLVTLRATPTGTFTYLWQDLTPPGPPPPIVAGSQLDIGPVENGHMMQVIIHSTVTGCDYTTQKTVFVIGEVVVSFPGVLNPCPGILFTLTATTTLSGVPQAAGVTYGWQLNGEPVGSNSSTHQDQQEGTYKVTATTSGCSDDFQEFIPLTDPTPGFLPERAIICNDPANPDCSDPGPNSCFIILDPDPTNRYKFTNHVWLPNGETDPTLDVTVPGIYIVQMENSYGCAVTDQTEVIEDCNPRIVAPTAFRPGSKVTENSSFSVFTYFIHDDDFQIFIYNRWGEMVYQADGLEENVELTKQSLGWNGGYKNNQNELLPAGTYSYVVKYKSSYHPEDGVKEKRGGVVLLR